jgi:hypothetical protein
MTARRAVELVLRFVTAAGLAVDAGVHLDLAPMQPPGGPGQLSQVTLFYAEGIVAAVVAVLVLAGARWTYVLAGVVAATALAAVLMSRYVDTGAIGPIPDLYEPVWYASKIAATLAEAAATLTAVLGVILARSHARHVTRSRNGVVIEDPQHLSV